MKKRTVLRVGTALALLDDAKRQIVVARAGEPENEILVDFSYTALIRVEGVSNILREILARGGG